MPKLFKCIQIISELMVVYFSLKTLADLEKLVMYYSHAHQDLPYATLPANRPPNFSLPSCKGILKNFKDN